jgi:hypothetical protein
MRKAAQIRWPRAPEYAGITDGGDWTGSGWYQGKECAAGGAGYGTTKGGGDRRSHAPLAVRVDLVRGQARGTLGYERSRRLAWCWLLGWHWTVP